MTEAEFRVMVRADRDEAVHYLSRYRMKYMDIDDLHTWVSNLNRGVTTPLCQFDDEELIEEAGCHGMFDGE